MLRKNGKKCELDIDEVPDIGHGNVLYDSC